MTTQPDKKVSDVVALVIDNGLFTELAILLGKTYKKVYYYCPWVNAYPKMNTAKIGLGFDEIEVVDSPDKVEDLVDCFVFPDVYFGAMQERLIKKGKNVWGARMGERLELDRVYCKELMAKIGLPVGPYKVVTGVPALREYLKTNVNQWVKVSKYRGACETFFSRNYTEIEPQLDVIEQELGVFKYILPFVCEDDLPDKVELGIDGYMVNGVPPSQLFSGIEVKNEAFVGVFKKYSEFPKELTAFDKAMQPEFKRLNYSGFYSTENRIGEDKVAYMVDFCFDDQTEILSERGWIPFKECKLTDRVATLNGATKQIEYQIPERLIAHRYDGKMVRITNRKRSIDCLVTPEHSVLRYDRNKTRLFKECADKLTDKGFIPRTGIWTPVAPPEFFTLPEYHHEWDFLGEFGHKVCTKIKHEPEIKIPMEDWAAFLAWYLSEGSTSSAPKGRPGIKYVTQISQTDHPDEVKEALDRLPFKFRYDGKMFRISSAQLATHLKDFGLCHEKFVPDYIKQSTQKVIRVFLDNYCLGDGSQRGSEKMYATTSRRMADDLQELIFKCGSVANMTTRPTKGTSMSVRGKTYVRKHDAIVLYERAAFKDFWFETGCRKSRYITDVEYHGMVYCATVPNGTLYVRRNGKPFWSGNCARCGSPPSEIYMEIYKNLPEIIWGGSRGQLVEPIPLAKFGSCVMIKSAWAANNWQPIDFPEELRRYVKLHYPTKINHRYYAIPQKNDIAEIGAIIGWGDTLKESIEMVKKIAEHVHGHFLSIPIASLDEAQEEIDKAEKFGLSMF
jgi:hypothetical protein